MIAGLASAHKSMQTTVNQDLGKSFVLDILPATLDDFVKWDQLGVQVDRDGDGFDEFARWQQYQC